jgi:hypothetical protein
MSSSSSRRIPHHTNYIIERGSFPSPSTRPSEKSHKVARSDNRHDRWACHCKSIKMASHQVPSLQSLPAEIRLHIYSYLLQPEPSTTTLSIRTFDPERYRNSFGAHNRARYAVMGGRLRSATLLTTYHLVDSSPETSKPELFPSILGVCRLFHREASQFLYSRYTFDFGKDVEAVVPFLSDLTPTSRRRIRNVKIVKGALPYTKEFDRCEWRGVCEYLAAECNLEQLGLQVHGGRVPDSQLGPTMFQPAGAGTHANTVQGANGATAQSSLTVAPSSNASQLPFSSPDSSLGRQVFAKSDFGLISRFEGMEWVRQLCAIKGLRSLDVGAIWEVCPPPCSNALAFFVSFSESIEGGFAEFLRENMVAGAA